MEHQPQQTGGEQGGEWKTDLFGCFDPIDLCVVGCFLPCLVVGKTAERMRDPTLATFEPINNDCLIMGGVTYLTGCGWIWAFLKRGEIREKYGIKGDSTSDCCTSYWCGCCAVIQAEKEVQRRTNGPHAAILEGYQAQHKEGMTMQQAPAHQQPPPPQGAPQMEMPQQQQYPPQGPPPAHQ